MKKNIKPILASLLLIASFPLFLSSCASFALSEYNCFFEVDGDPKYDHCRRQREQVRRNEEESRRIQQELERRGNSGRFRQ